MINGKIVIGCFNCNLLVVVINFVSTGLNMKIQAN